MTLNLNLTDLQGFSESQREPEMRALAREEKTRPFDIVNGPLLRVKLFRTSPEQHVLFTTIHHVITDGWSINVFFQDLAACYEALSRDRQPSLTELPIQFVDFSSWQRQALEDDSMLNQLAYWEEQLKGPLAVLELATNRPRSSELSFLTARTLVSVTGDVFDSLKKLSRDEMSTLFMTVLSALKILLYAHSGQEDIRVGTLVANREWGETDKLIGHFVNTLIIRTRINAGSSFRQLQRDVRHTTLEAQARQSLPFETLLRSLERATNLNRSALAQVMFVYQTAAPNCFEPPGLTVELLEDIHDTVAPDITITTFDLILLMKETQTGLLGSLIYKTEVFDETIIGQFLSHFHEILERIGSDPEQLISELCIQKLKPS